MRWRWQGPRSPTSAGGERGNRRTETRRLADRATTTAQRKPGRCDQRRRGDCRERDPQPVRARVRGAHSRTGIAAADFSRIRNADLGRFTVDRLMLIINRLGSRVEVRIKVRRGQAGEHVALF